MSSAAVGAHRLLGSSAIVSMGIGTLLNMWQDLQPHEVDWLLRRIAEHASTVDDGLKHIARGVDTVGGEPGADGGQTDGST